MARTSTTPEKPLHWVGSSKKDLLAFPGEVVDDLGYALSVVQHGGTPPSAKAWVVLIHERLRTAQTDYEVRYAKKED